MLPSVKQAHGYKVRAINELLVGLRTKLKAEFGTDKRNKPEAVLEKQWLMEWLFRW